MRMTNIFEKWDALLCSLINVIAMIKYMAFSLRMHGILSKNKLFKAKHKGERCFIVLNGPSINQYDLSPLKNEIVFATNFFFRAPLCKVVNPNYYCWLDSKILMSDDGKNIIKDLLECCPNSNLFLNYKAASILGKNDKISYVYSKQIPNCMGIRNNLAGMSSNFSTVAFFAMATALYMGFKEIYVLGLDFEPGGFTHFANLGTGTECDRPSEKLLKDEVCGLHWGYVKAQYESYYIADLAKKNGSKIVNLNPNSCIRSFEFGDYNDILKKTKI